MKHTAILLLILYTLFSNAQERNIYVFEKLSVIDTIRNPLEINRLKSEANIIDSNLFLIENYQKDNLYLSILVFRKDKNWIVYETPFEMYKAFVGFKGYSNERNYAFFEIEYFGYGTNYNTEISELYIIDLVNDSYTAFQSKSYYHSFDHKEDGKPIFIDYSMNTSQIIINNKMITVIESNIYFGGEKENNCSQYGAYDTKSGIYEIQDQKLIKTHYYDTNTKQMKPLIYAGNVAIGMALRDFIGSNNWSIEEVSCLNYGYDVCYSEETGEENGMEIWLIGQYGKKEELLYFLIVPDRYSDVKRIEYLTVISPEIEVHGLYTDMTVEDVFSKHPDAKSYIDLISDWEYIYIENLNLKVIFKTDKHNRIAQYKLNEKDGSAIMTKISDKTRKVDFIEILK